MLRPFRSRYFPAINVQARDLAIVQIHFYFFTIIFLNDFLDVPGRFRYGIKGRLFIWLATEPPKPSFSKGVISGFQANVAVCTHAD